MSIRLTGKQFFLTYPQCPVSKEVALISMEDKGHLTAYIISEEQHKDGTPHLHVYLKFERKKNFKSPKCFDIEFDGHTYHGNYQTVKNADAVMTYVKKDNNFIEKLEEEEHEEDILEFARHNDNETFLKECIKRKIGIGYYNEIKSIINKNNTINEDSAGNSLFNEEKFKNAYHNLDSIQTHPLYMIPEMDENTPLLESQSSLQDQQDVEKQLGASTNSQNQFYSSLTSTLLNNTTPNTSLFSSTTYPSNIFREKAKSIWSTVNNLDQSTLDTAQWTFQQDWSKPLLQTITHSTKWSPQLKEEYVY